MNWKTMSPLTILLIVIIAMVGTVGIIYAVGQLDIGGSVEVTNTIPTLASNSSDLNWGQLTRTASKNMTLQLHNNGETATDALLITYPSFPSTYLSIQSFGELTAIPPDGYRDITFELTVLQNAANTVYPFGITIGYIAP